VTARTTGSVVISASADGRTTAMSVQAVLDISGSWTDQTRDVDSTQVSGAGPFRPMTGLVRPLSFTLIQTGNSVSGTGLVDLNSGSRPAHCG
jgi:hypothetical protein